VGGAKDRVARDVRAEPLVVRERGSGSREALERALGGAGLDLGAPGRGRDGSRRRRSSRLSARASASRSSRGGRSRTSAGAAARALPIRDLKVDRAFWLVTHRERTRSPLALAFVAFVESHPLVVAS